MAAQHLPQNLGGQAVDKITRSKKKEEALNKRGKVKIYKKRQIFEAIERKIWMKLRNVVKTDADCF